MLACVPLRVALQPRDFGQSAPHLVFTPDSDQIADAPTRRIKCAPATPEPA